MIADRFINSRRPPCFRAGGVLSRFPARKSTACKSGGSPRSGTPVFTIKGEYTSRGWTEWTQGFQFGAALYQFEVDARRGVPRAWAGATRSTAMAPHRHAHRRARSRLQQRQHLRKSAAPDARGPDPVQRVGEEFLRAGAEGDRRGAGRSRWTQLDARSRATSIRSTGRIRSLPTRSARCARWRSSHQLGHRLMGEMDRPISLLERLLQHAETTARYAVYFGEGRDAYDVRGPHRARIDLQRERRRLSLPEQPAGLLALHDLDARAGVDSVRLPGGTRISRDAVRKRNSRPFGGKRKVLDRFLAVAEAVADFYIEYTPIDGIPYWDTGAPGLAQHGRLPGPPGRAVQRARAGRQQRRGDRRAGPAAARRLSQRRGRSRKGRPLLPGGLDRRAARSSREPYLSTDPDHEGLILHSVYHRPNGWDYIPPGQQGAVRRGLHVGRLPCARAGRHAAARRPRPARPSASSIFE